MATITEQIYNISADVAALRSRIMSLSPNDIIYSVLGEVIVYGCKVTQGTSASDMIVALEGQASGDSTHLNPDLDLAPIRGFQYPNIASTKDGAFRSTDTTAVVEAAPGTGEGRYDIAYIYVGPSGAGFKIASGTPSTAAKTDFDTNGMEDSNYGLATIPDPELPVGAMAVARIYVEDDVTGIPNARIADIRNFFGISGTLPFDTIEVNNLIAQDATIENLDATSADIGDISADTISTDSINVNGELYAEYTTGKLVTLSIVSGVATVNLKGATFHGYLNTGIHNLHFINKPEAGKATVHSIMIENGGAYAITLTGESGIYFTRPDSNPIVLTEDGFDKLVATAYPSGEVQIDLRKNWVSL